MVFTAGLILIALGWLVQLAVTFARRDPRINPWFLGL